MSEKAWQELLAATESSNFEERKQALKRAVTGPDKALFAGLVPYLDQAPAAGAILQFALEQAPEHPLYALGYATATSGTWSKSIFVAIRPPAEQPLRSVYGVAIDRGGDRLYAADQKTVSVWSLETAEHLEDLKGSKGLKSIYQTPDGTLRGLSGSGELYELLPKAKAFKVRAGVKVSFFSAVCDGRWLVDYENDYDREVVAVTIFDLDAKTEKKVDVPAGPIHERMIDGPTYVARRNDGFDLVDLVSGKVVHKRERAAVAKPNYPTRAADGGEFHILHDSNWLLRSFDPKRNRVIIFGVNAPLPMYLVSPWDPKTAPKPSAGGKRVATAAPPKPVGDPSKLHPLLAGIGYRQSDFDADDRYLFSCVLEKTGALRVSFTSSVGAGTFLCTKAALGSGKRKIEITQGDATIDGTTVLDKKSVPAFPPWLMPRSLFATLRAGGTVRWPSVWTGEEVVVLTNAGAGSVSIEVDGKKQTFATVRAVGDGAQLEIVDDDAWPIIVRDSEADGCGWTLLAAGKSLKLADLD